MQRRAETTGEAERHADVAPFFDAKRNGVARSHHAARDLDLLRLEDELDGILGGHNPDEWHEGERPQGLQDDFDDTGNSPRAGFIPNDGQALPFELVGQGLLSPP